jgi:hypothetical protein
MLGTARDVDSGAGQGTAFRAFSAGFGYPGDMPQSLQSRLYRRLPPHPESAVCHVCEHQDRGRVIDHDAEKKQHASYSSTFFLVIAKLHVLMTRPIRTLARNGESDRFDGHAGARRATLGESLDDSDSTVTASDCCPSPTPSARTAETPRLGIIKSRLAGSPWRPRLPIRAATQ